MFTQYADQLNTIDDQGRRDQVRLDIRPWDNVGAGIRISVQASSFHYCEPKTDGLPIGAYTHVEVGVLGDDGLCLPSSLGVGGYDHYFEQGLRSPVAPFFPADLLPAMFDQLEAAARDA